MATTPLAQRLYDKTKADFSTFRGELTEWSVKQISSGLTYGGTIVDMLWQNCRTHLERKVAEYFEWIEKESRDINPSSLKRDSIDQCVGAVIGYSRQVRQTAVEKNRVLQHLGKGVDLGRWEEVDDAAIAARGKKLLGALGIGPTAKWSARLNHLVNDHAWFFGPGIISFLISIALLAIAFLAFNRG